MKRTGLSGVIYSSRVGGKWHTASRAVPCRWGHTVKTPGGKMILFLTKEPPVLSRFFTQSGALFCCGYSLSGCDFDVSRRGAWFGNGITFLTQAFEMKFYGFMHITLNFFHCLTR